MPYIKEVPRIKYDSNLQKLGEHINTEDELNYCITKLLHLFVEKHGVNYKNLSKCIGGVECAKLEFYRRIVSPYEDMKMIENGDV